MPRWLRSRTTKKAFSNKPLSRNIRVARGGGGVGLSSAPVVVERPCHAVPLRHVVSVQKKWGRWLTADFNPVEFASR
jgi:hypothetical protein